MTGGCLEFNRPIVSIPKFLDEAFRLEEEICWVLTECDPENPVPKCSLAARRRTRPAVRMVFAFGKFSWPICGN